LADSSARRRSGEGARRGGGHNAKDERNIRAAKAYRQVRKAPKNIRKTDSFLKEQCGLAVGCKSRGAAIAAVEAGEKLLEDAPRNLVSKRRPVRQAP
jgi:hypothetical protein